MELPDFLADDPNWENRPYALPETVFVRTDGSTVHSVMDRQTLARLLQSGGELVAAPEEVAAPVEEAVEAPVEEVPAEAPAEAAPEVEA